MAKKNRNSKDNGKPKRSKNPRPRSGTVRRRFPPKSLEEIAKEQGKELRPWTDEGFQRMVELGKELFRSHKQREAFFAGIYERRRQSRGK